ncbi:hypothetical protein CASFOL_019947 [Castilleja foliolosa]|uniref:KIB1-4 beta-propeller domain-containing protein n=1 Tax=Castilleja foliolosa TaxID=1961234 RepID=A0ABD3CZF8_9LAMI
MGEKKMIKKEIKSPSKKKVEPAAVVPRDSWFYYKRSPISCPSLPRNYEKYCTIEESISGSGGITKSWIKSRCTHQTWPQLAEINIYPKDVNINNWQDHKRHLKNIHLRMSAPLRTPVVVITGISFPAFAYYKLGYYKLGKYYSYCCWRTRDCRIIDPYSSDNTYMEFTNVIGFQGIIYAISHQGCLAIIELVEREGDSGNYEITALGNSRVVPDCRVSKHFREYLLEYGGEIYVVFLLSRVSIKVVDDVEVFRLDKSKLLWKKVDHLVGDAMFFLQDKSCIGISASLLGCSKGSDCVYFTHDKADGAWFVYDMKSGCISTTPGPEIDL